MPFTWKSTIEQGDTVWHDSSDKSQITEIRDHIGIICISDNVIVCSGVDSYICSTDYVGHLNLNDATVNEAFDASDNITYDRLDFSVNLIANDTPYYSANRAAYHASVLSGHDVSFHSYDCSSVLTANDSDYHSMAATIELVSHDIGEYSFHNAEDYATADTGFWSGYNSTLHDTDYTGDDSSHNNTYDYIHNGDTP